MLVQQKRLTPTGWAELYSDTDFTPLACSFVLGFGDRLILQSAEVYERVSKEYPGADTILVSTAGEIAGESVYDNSIVLTAVSMAHTRHKCYSINIADFADSQQAGAALMKTLQADDLSTVLVFSDGGVVNGSELIKGLNDNNPKNISIAGGLAGDAARFQMTLTGLNAAPAAGNIIAIGLYGDRIKASHGSSGGWDEFGPERTITRADKNVIYELDGRNALDLYKQYLGDYVSELPSSALLFPLSLKTGEDEKKVVRTILSISNDGSSMTFAGNMPVGGKVRLMKANFDKLIAAAGDAASETATTGRPDLAILVSCVGRKLILKDRIDEEVEAASAMLGRQVPMTGFYSYGELSPKAANNLCELHNQTMTILTLSEV